MNAMRRVAALIALAIVLVGCVVYEPVPVDPMEAPWRSAIGAVEDAGLQLVAADRATGTIRGTRGAAEGTIVVRMRNDGRVGVEINSKGEPGLTQRLTDAYNRRMGR
jgi:PBP1b-binding outer membrane lipoprotein LpoB